MKDRLILILLLTIFISGCKKDPPPEDQSKQKIVFKFDFNVNGEDLQTDALMYTNAAGNQYLVNEIQYFISDVTLHNTDGSSYLVEAWKDIHYIDSDIPETQTWDVFDNIPEGSYNSISFTFGINEEKNQSLMFLNPPESYMFWPENLGGGYHYMKLNGKWLAASQQVTPFDFHLGIGQIYYSYPDSITGFVQNYFEVALPNSSFTIAKDETKEIRLTMNIENWFRNPNIYDHNTWGGDIMQKQEAMALACENGGDVFGVVIR
jgi:hypothetical protein